MSDHPDENEINEMLEVAAHKINTIYEVVFEVSQFDAELLVDCWRDATSGDTEAVYKLMSEMGKLIGVLQEQMEGQ